MLRPRPRNVVQRSTSSVYMKNRSSKPPTACQSCRRMSRQAPLTQARSPPERLRRSTYRTAGRTFRLYNDSRAFCLSSPHGLMGGPNDSSARPPPSTRRGHDGVWIQEQQQLAPSLRRPQVVGAAEADIAAGLNDLHGGEPAPDQVRCTVRRIVIHYDHAGGMRLGAAGKGLQAIADLRSGVVGHDDDGQRGSVSGQGRRPRERRASAPPSATNRSVPARQAPRPPGARGRHRS